MIAQDFDAFYNAFPKRQGRSLAYRCYLAAIYYQGATHESLMQGVEAYKQHLMNEQTEFQFIKSPAKWLEGGHWADEYEANLPKQQSNIHVGETMSQYRTRMESEGKVINIAG